MTIEMRGYIRQVAKEFELGGAYNLSTLKNDYVKDRLRSKMKVVVINFKICNGITFIKRGFYY